VIHEFDLYGLLLSPMLIWALVAFALRAVLRRLLANAGFYRLVSHPALFDMALFVILLGALVAISSRFALT
jgi:protein-S-isoprenylcysteine O-methyltransferase Ste14